MSVIKRKKSDAIFKVANRAQIGFSLPFFGNLECVFLDQNIITGRNNSTQNTEN